MPATILHAATDSTESPRVMQTAAQSGQRIRSASSRGELERELTGGFIDVLVVDLALLGTRWIDWLTDARERWPDLSVVLFAEGPTEADSIEAIRAGAIDLLQRPLDEAELTQAIRNAIAAAEHAAAAPPPASVRHLPHAQPTGTVMVGDSPAMREVSHLIQRAANSSATVLIRGESGSGKEVIAHRIHDLSPRSRGPFVKIHCAAIPEALLESELFGHEKGAFTGATCRKPGRVEIADGGTLFLDEIGDISATIQVKLLRLLQDKQYERIGSNRTIAANVRFVAATHRPLEEMIQRGEFREDLYYRLNVISIRAPSLRARPEDVGLLARHFCNTFGEQNGKPKLGLDPEAIAVLQRQPWPGNVRQLQNFVERLVVFAESDLIDRAAVMAELGSPTDRSAMAPTGGEPELDFTISVLELDEVVRRAERKALEKALHKAGGNRTVAARILGVSRRTLYNKLEEHALL